MKFKISFITLICIYFSDDANIIKKKTLHYVYQFSISISFILIT